MRGGRGRGAQESRGGSRGVRGRRGPRAFRGRRGGDRQPFIDNKKYFRAPEETKREDPPENHLYVGANQGISRSINRALEIFEENKGQDVIIKASGNAVGNAIRLAEMIRHGREGVYIKNELENREIKTIYKPREQGLDDVEVNRHVSSLNITLSLKKQPGFQDPPLASEITPLTRNTPV
jgi:DNA-binding protein